MGRCAAAVANHPPLRIRILFKRLLTSPADLKNNGVHVTRLPVLRSGRQLANGDFAFELFADTGTFTVLRSTDLQTWTEIATTTITTPNFPGTAFTDTSAHLQQKAFYRVKYW